MSADFKKWRGILAVAGLAIGAFFGGRALPTFSDPEPPAAPAPTPPRPPAPFGAAAPAAPAPATPRTPAPPPVATVQSSIDPFAFLRRPEPAPINPAADRLARLQAVLDEEATRVPGFFSAHVRLEDGGEAGVNAYQPMEGASLIKVPVMAALYAAWDAGFTRRTNEDEQKLRQMVTRSRNIPTNHFIEKLGMQRINAWLAANSYGSTGIIDRVLSPSPIGANQTTAADMTRMLQQIVRGELVSPEASLEMRELLLDQRWRDRIPAGIPDEAVVGNKTGTLSVVLHDVAFVEPPRGPRYTVAIMIARPSRAEVKAETIERISRRIYTVIAGVPSPQQGSNQWPRPSRLPHRWG
ncbi:MAG: serine hydrolase [Armatimonadota bacterium]